MSKLSHKLIKIDTGNVSLLISPSGYKMNKIHNLFILLTQTPFVRLLIGLSELPYRLYVECQTT